MADENHVERTARFINPDVHHVDISKCVAGSHARAIKYGGVDSLMTSMRGDGYKKVHTY
jgi:hypothetical protein